MYDASISTSWTYNPRGQVTSETQTITNGGTFLTQWGYNNADLVTSMTYPLDFSGDSGEKVTYGYNDRMLLASVSGTSNYATMDQPTDYDAAGRLLPAKFW